MEKIWFLLMVNSGNKHGGHPVVCGLDCFDQLNKCCHSREIISSRLEGVNKWTKNGSKRFQPYKSNYKSTIITLLITLLICCAIILSPILSILLSKFYLVGMKYRMLSIREKYGNQHAQNAMWTSERFTKLTELNF